VQASATSHDPAAGRHTVPDGATPSAGHCAAAPVHFSARSHGAHAERHTVPDATKPSLGHTALVPLHFSAFHPDYKMPDVPGTPPATLVRARNIALAHGLHYVYTGNVHNQDGGPTYCPPCKTPLIVRDWYRTNH